MRISIDYFFTKEIIGLFLQLIRKEVLIFWGELKVKWVQGCTSLDIYYFSLYYASNGIAARLLPLYGHRYNCYIWFL